MHVQRIVRSNSAAPLPSYERLRVCELVVWQQLVPLITGLKRSIIDRQQDVRNHSPRHCLNLVSWNRRMRSQRRPLALPRPGLQIFFL